MMHKHDELPSSWPQSSANMIWPHKHSTNHENGEAKETEDKRKPKTSAQISPLVAVRLFNDISQHNSQHNSQHKRTPTAKVHSPMRLFATSVWRGVAADKRQPNDDEGWWMENEKRRRRWCERCFKENMKISRSLYILRVHLVLLRTYTTLVQWRVATNKRVQPVVYLYVVCSTSKYTIVHSKSTRQ